MKSAQTLDLKLEPPAQAKQEIPQSGDDGKQMNNLIEQTRSDVSRMRMQLNHQEDAHEAHARRTKGLFIVVVLLLLGLGAAAWFTYPAIRDQQKFGVSMLSLQSASNAFGKRMESIQGKLDSTIAGMPALSGRIDELSANMKSGLQGARSQAEAAATRVRAEVNQSIQSIQSRVTGLESNQKEASGHVSELEQQISTLKQELASVREEASASANTIKQLQEEQQARATAFSTMDQKMTTHQTALDSLANRMDAKRVDFGLQNHKTEQIAPDVFMTITRMDAKRQEVDATLQLSKDSRMIPIRSHRLRTPMVFRTSADSRAIELVFTDIANNKVSGYLMMPAPAVAATSASNPLPSAEGAAR